MNIVIPIALSILCIIFGFKYLYRAAYVVCTMIYVLSLDREYHKTCSPGMAVDFDEMYILTEREKETAFYLFKGYTYKETALEMNISINTLRSHIKSIYEKYKIHSRTELYHIVKNTRSGKA